MRKETIVKFEESDFELLKGGIPSNPCQKCTPAERAACCGCPAEREYRQQMKPFIDAGIEEYAQTFLDLHNGLDTLRNLVREMRSDIEHLPKELREIVMDTNVIFYKNNPNDEAIFEMFKTLMHSRENKSGNPLLAAASKGAVHN